VSLFAKRGGHQAVIARGVVHASRSRSGRDHPSGAILAAKPRGVM